MFVASPNNPTGLLVDPEQIEEMLRRVPPDRLVVLDQAYVEYAREGYSAATLGLLPRYPNLIILRSFSKIHGLAGMRVGYGIANEDLIALLDRVRLPFSVTMFAERAAMAALDDDEHVRRSQAENAAGKELLTAELGRMGLRVWPSHANFILVDVGRSSEYVFQALLRRGVIIRPMRSPRIPTHIRVTIGTADEIETFVRALREVL